MSSDPNPAASLRSGDATSGMISSSDDASSETGLKEEGKQLASKAVDKIHAEADKRKDGVTNQIKAVSSAIGTAADQIEREDDLPTWLTSGIRKVATRVEEFAHTLDGKSSTELFGDLKVFASERPAVFLASCAVAGFAASRVLSAGNGSGGAR